MDRELVVFARAPAPGQVKTRLAATVGDGAARAFYEAFVDDTLAAAAEAARRSGAGLVLAVAGDLAHPRVAAWARTSGAALVAQPPGDLGARLGAFFADGRHVCVIGSDAPQLGAAQLARGFDALVGHEVAIGPSRDGGYWLLGARRPIPELLAGMPWSTPELLSRTLEALAGRSAALLEMAFDVDDADDLALLQRWLAVAPPEIAPATRAALARGAQP